VSIAWRMDKYSRGIMYGGGYNGEHAEYHMVDGPMVWYGTQAWAEGLALSFPI
jgi:hypothetical protein